MRQIINARFSIRCVDKNNSEVYYEHTPMKILIAQTLMRYPDQAIRRIGYGLHQDRRTGEKSFVRRIAHDLFPRFHLYLEAHGTDWQLNLHFDQRQTVYEGVTAHGGEYDTDIVLTEGDRIKALLEKQD